MPILCTFPCRLIRIDAAWPGKNIGSVADESMPCSFIGELTFNLFDPVAS